MYIHLLCYEPFTIATVALYVREFAEDGAGFDVEQVAEFTYQRDARGERAWLSVPIFTKYYLPGLPYQDRMRVLAKAYDRLGTGHTELSRWVAFAARASG